MSVLVVESRDVFDRVVHPDMLLVGEHIVQSPVPIALPDTPTTLQVIARRRGFSEVRATIEWNPSATEPLVAERTAHALEVSQTGWAASDGSNSYRLVVRFLRLRDASSHSTYRLFLRNLRFNVETPTEGLILRDRHVVQPGPSLATQSYVLQADSGRYFAFARQLADPHAEVPTVVTPRSGRGRVSQRLPAGAPRIVFVWVPQATLQALASSAETPLDFHMTYHPFPTHAWNTSDPFRAIHPASENESDFRLHIANDYQNVFAVYSVWNQRYVHQHMMSESRSVFVMPMGDTTGNLHEARSAGEVHRMLREIAYLLRRTMRRSSMNTTVPSSIRHVGVSCFSAGVRALTTLLQDRISPRDPAFLRSHLVELFDLDGVDTSGDSHYQVFERWLRNNPSASIRSYRAIQTGLAETLQSAFRLTAPIVGANGLHELHDTNGNHGFTLLWGNHSLWGRAFPRRPNHRLRGGDVHHTVPAYALSHALSMSRLE